MTYQLPSEGTSWSSVFRQLEDHKERLGIVDYSVSQTTLEQVEWKHTISCVHKCLLLANICAVQLQMLKEASTNCYI